MLNLQTVYPLNNRVGDEDTTEKESRVTGNKFLPSHHLYNRPGYNYSKIKLNSFLKQNFVNILIKHLDHNLLKERCWLFICVYIKSFKKSFLKHTCNDVYDVLSSRVDSFSSQQWYEMTLDLIESRIYNLPVSKLQKPSHEM